MFYRQKFGASSERITLYIYIYIYIYIYDISRIRVKYVYFSYKHLSHFVFNGVIVDNSVACRS
jgi:hypothetical protein